MNRLALARQGGPGFFAFPYISQIIYLPGHAFENANVTPPIGAKTTHEFVSGTDKKKVAPRQRKAAINRTHSMTPNMPPGASRLLLNCNREVD